MSDSSEKLSNLAMMAMGETVNHLKEQNERLRAYVGSEIFRSDFQTAGHMRAELERLRAQVQIRAGQVIDLQQTVTNREQELERLRAESSAFEQAWKDACARAEKMAEDLATTKALLRELLPYVEEWHTPSEEHAERIRAALGEEL